MKFTMEMLDEGNIAVTTTLPNGAVAGMRFAPDVSLGDALKNARRLVEINAATLPVR